MRSKCVLLPKDVTAEVFNTEWTEQERLEYGNHEGDVIVFCVFVYVTQSAYDISYVFYCVQNFGIYSMEPICCAATKAEGK